MLSSRATAPDATVSNEHRLLRNSRCRAPLVLEYDRVSHRVVVGEDFFPARNPSGFANRLLVLGLIA